ncbi:unnamed protein product [Danaus chrysippus]|uniref:(African queen) hypothetical protein n=1 Tax=Danaus chrysippus TaxID=151541 RepID=A0A8J2VT36_9NEOP|nr:unnamed protein product [Danaus chrysippus]
MSSYPKVEESRYSSEDRENIRATTFLRTPRYSWASTGNTHPELGVGASVVLDLISKLPPGTYSFYMDNYFTSLPLLDEIKTLGHDATGTVRANRVEKAPLKEAKDMKKMSRGSFDQCTDTLTNITLVRYNDNNIVTVASTECGVEPLAKTFPENSSSVKKPIPRSSLAVIKRVPVDIRLDGKAHHIIKSDKQNRCGLCHKNTTMKCGKCNVALHQKCSPAFHTK